MKLHKQNMMSDSFRWALDSIRDPSMAAADWLARDIDPNCDSAVKLLTNKSISLSTIQKAKSVFKTMRIVGEKSADRRLGARLYAATIAAGLVQHGKLVSSQSDQALKRAFQGLLDDKRLPPSLRDIGGMALCILEEQRFKRIEKDQERRKSA